MSIFLWKLTSGYRPWSYCEHLGDAVHDPIGTHLIGEKGIHGSSGQTHYPKGPLHDIGDPFPCDLGKGPG